MIRDLSQGRRLEANQQRFLANAAHELKTPITSIAGAAELLLTEEEDDPEVRHRFLNHILRESHTMQRLSETLLRLARVGTDLRDPDIKIVDLNEVAREAAERIRLLAKAEKIELRVEGQGACVWADREWLEQCLLIVLRNAVQHSGGEGVVSVRTTGETVTLEDKGTGIDPEDLPHIFERFYRGKSGSEGFGLGLPICKDLVERMGGSIKLESQKGAGTIVEIKLPKAFKGERPLQGESGLFGGHRMGGR